MEDILQINGQQFSRSQIKRDKKGRQTAANYHKKTEVFARSNFNLVLFQNKTIIKDAFESTKLNNPLSMR